MASEPMWSQEDDTGPELPSLVPAQDAQPELQDDSPEDWHVRFRAFNGWEDADPIRDLRMLRELCHRWLRPEVHTKEQIMDQLVLEQFLICTPLEVQVLLKESGVTSCRDLEELLRNSWSYATDYSIIISQGQKFLQWNSGTEMVGSETGVTDGVMDLSRQHRPSAAEIPPEASQSPAQALQVPAWTQDPCGGAGEAPQPRSTAVKRDPEEPSPGPHLEEGRESDGPQPLGAPADSGEDANEGVIACGSGADPPPIPALEAEASARGGSRSRRHVKKRREHPQAENSRFPAAACLAGAPPHPTPALRLYRCGDCSKSFCYRSQLVIHQRSHTGERPFQCEDCSKGFMQPSDLRVHQRIHTGEKPFVCADCGRAFSHEASLVTHRRVHTQERPYVCKYCGQSFNHKGNLNVHCRIHTNVKPYRCEVCGHCFRQLGTFKRHLKIHERTVPPEQELWLRRMMAGSRGLAPAGGEWHAPHQEPPDAVHPAPAWPLLALPGAAGHLLPGFLDERASRTPTTPMPAERHTPE